MDARSEVKASGVLLTTVGPAQRGFNIPSPPDTRSNSIDKPLHPSVHVSKLITCHH